MKKLSVLSSCYFKADGAIPPVPKRIEHFIFRDP